YHDPLMTICADKYAVREYIKETIGEEYLIPLIGVWDKVEDIDFNSLPNQFVLKVNWGSGQNIIVKDKSTLNIEEIKKKLEYW
ncbi:ATP-grasp fold amidoligase family protein, partial [Brachyspira hyodysenteriae]